MFNPSSSLGASWFSQNAILSRRVLFTHNMTPATGVYPIPGVSADTFTSCSASTPAPRRWRRPLHHGRSVGLPGPAPWWGSGGWLLPASQAAAPGLPAHTALLRGGGPRVPRSSASCPWSSWRASWVRVNSTQEKMVFEAVLLWI